MQVQLYRSARVEYVNINGIAIRLIQIPEGQRLVVPPIIIITNQVIRHWVQPTIMWFAQILVELHWQVTFQRSL